MMNLLALSLVLSTLLAAEVWSPSPAMTTNHGAASEGDVIVKDGHRVVVVEYDRDGKTNTRVSISPPSADEGEGDNEEGKGGSLFKNAKERVKETASHLPHVGQGISQPLVETKEETEEAPDHHATAGELICDAFGKCRQKIASVVGRAKDRTADTVGETVSDVEGAAGRKAHDVKETVTHAARDVEDTVAGKARYAKEKVTEKAHDVRESVAHKAHDAKDKVRDKAYDVKETVAQKAHESKERAKDRVRGKAHELKETVAHKSQNAWERVKNGVREFGSAAVGALTTRKHGVWDYLL